MPSPLLLKLENFARLAPEDGAAVEQLAAGRRQFYAAQTEIAVQGRRPRQHQLIHDGWAIRYKMLSPDRRQVIGILLPGDLCEPHAAAPRRADHAIAALTPATVVSIPYDHMEAVVRDREAVRQAFLQGDATSAAIQREWTVSLGKRTAKERIGHLFCELFWRLRAVGLAESDSCALPLTQNDIADAMGVSPVHVNRTLQELRQDELIVLKSRRLTIPDLAALANVSLFAPEYLNFGLPQ